jgi:methylenetetrahydrofolate dehydrogenase (NADP+)/methenyltetrahydrofolate cyclohydrolase
MQPIRGRDLLRQVKNRCEPLKSEFSGKKVTIFRFAPPRLATDPLVLAKYESARYSTDSKVKTFQFLGCEVDSQLLAHSTSKSVFASLLLAASREEKNVGIIVQNPLPDLLKPLLALIPSRQDLDGMAENHPIFKANATAETIARLVQGLARPDSIQVQLNNPVTWLMDVLLTEGDENHDTD